MKPKLFGEVLLLASVGAVLHGCAPADESSTTVIVVRHAEKATGQGDDPQLSPAGAARARALARALHGAGVTGVITTEYRRTVQTAAPTAIAAGVTPEVVTEWSSIPRHVSAVLAAVRGYSGGVVLVVGHSNTVPEIVAALGAGPSPQVCESEYDRLEIVDLASDGDVRRIASRYGMPTEVGADCTPVGVPGG